MQVGMNKSFKGYQKGPEVLCHVTGSLFKESDLNSESDWQTGEKTAITFYANTTSILYIPEKL